MRNFYVFVLMLLIGAWANVTQVAAQDATLAVTKAVRVTALDQLATGSQIVIRNAGSSTERNGFIYESGTDLMINTTATSLVGLSYDHVFTLADYSATDGTCYMTANSGKKISGFFQAGTNTPMQTVETPEGKLTLSVEGTNKWDIKGTNERWFNTKGDPAFLNSFDNIDDPNASWEIYMVVDDATFMPEEGQAYYFQCKGNNKKATYLPNMTILGAEVATLHLGQLFTLSAVASNGEVRYQIKSYAKQDAYVYYVNTGDENANVGITTDASNANRNWKFVTSTNDATGFNIIPSTGSNGWNCRGTEGVWFTANNSAIGQWSSNGTADNTWFITSVADDDLTAAVNAYKEKFKPTFGTVGAYNESDYTTELNNYTTTEAIFLNVPYIQNQLSLIKPTSASGLYKIKNRALAKYLFQETDAKNITFINDGVDNTDNTNNTKYYYRVKFDGNQATIVNYNGKPLARGGQGQRYSSAQTIVTSPVTLTYCGGDGYFLFPNTHSTNQRDYTKNYANYDSSTNPLFLTSYPTTGNANQYTFEEVAIPEGSYVYDVQFEGLKGLSGDDALTVTYNNTNYTGIKEVPNGGFYVISGTPAAGDFKVSESDYTTSVTVDEINHVVKVTFTGEPVNVTYKIKMNGVEYASQAVRVLSQFKSKSLLGNYSGFANCDAVTMQVNEGEAVPVKSCFDENGTNTLASVNDGDTYTFALKTTDLLNGVQPSDMTSVEGMEKGKLYQISSAITKVLSGGRGGKKIYGKPEMIYTKAVGDNLETEPFLAMAHSLWMFVYTDIEQGYFKIYNQVTGKYMGPVVNHDTNVAFTDEAGAGVYKLIPTTAIHHTDQTTDEMRKNMSNQPLFKIAASDATLGLGDEKKLHIQNTGSNQLIGYDQDEIWSKWYFTASLASPTKVEFVKDIDQRLLVQGRVTPSKKADMTGMVITKEDGTNVTTVLTDDDATTSASGSLNSYLEVDLGSTNVSAFAFYTKRYGSNNNNRPTEIEVQASVNGTDFTRLYTFYGIPVANEDFYSPSYPLNGQRYLRFVVKATYLASSTFDFSEFHIQTTKGVLPDDLATKSLEAGKKAIDAVCSAYNTDPGYYQGASEALYKARNNALEYAAAHKALKDRIADLTPFINRTDMVEGDEVHQFTIARTATAAEDWKAALNEINTYVDDVNNANINTKVGCETVLATLPAITFNTPKPGQVYRLKSKEFASDSNAASYVGTDGSMTGGRLALSGVPSAGNEKDLLLLYTSDKKLVSPITGAELTVNNLNHFDFSEHRSEDGTYRVATFNPDNASDENARILYANEGGSYGKIDYSQIGGDHETVTNTSWYLEPVKSYSVKMNPVGNHHWATFYSDKKVLLPEGVKARYVKGNDDGNWAETTDGSKVYKLVYTTVGEGGVLPAGTGVWLDKRTADGNDATGQETVVLCESEYNDAAAVESNWFVGSEAGNDAYTTSGKLYALGKPGDNPAGFYTFTATQETETNRTYKLTAKKAYLEVPSSVVASLNAFGFVLVEDEGEVTGVQDVPVAGDAVEDDGVYYDLTGKRVVNPTQRGIYIKNGKKMVIK